ncbi:MAG: VOC family protein [Candidatus Melainabacteria bacterium]|nr:VOC family protein [Candidatus Melainabacteria bacterium]
MRLDHIAYRVKNRDAAVQFFTDMFGYVIQCEFEITLEDGSKAMCMALEPPEKHPHGQALEGLPFISHVSPGLDYHMAPEIFVSEGPPGSLIDRWVNEWGRGVGAVHHLAYEVGDVKATMDQWQAKGILFTTPEPLHCDDLVQVFTQPHPITGIIYEFIERKGQHGFCKDNVAKLMASTAHLVS